MVDIPLSNTVPTTLAKQPEIMPHRGFPYLFPYLFYSTATSTTKEVEMKCRPFRQSLFKKNWNSTFWTICRSKRYKTSAQGLVILEIYNIAQSDIKLIEFVIQEMHVLISDNFKKDKKKNRWSMLVFKLMKFLTIVQNVFLSFPLFRFSCSILSLWGWTLQRSQI